MTERPTRAQKGAARGAPSLILGEDWVYPASVDEEIGRARRLRGWRTLNQSPLSRRIVIYCVLPVFVMAIGLLLANGTRETVAARGLAALETHARLMATMLSASDLPAEELIRPDIVPKNLTAVLYPRDGSQPRLLVAEQVVPTSIEEGKGSRVTAFFMRLGENLRALLPFAAGPANPSPVDLADQLAEAVRSTGEQKSFPSDLAAATSLGTGLPVSRADADVLVLVSSGAFIGDLTEVLREKVLRAFLLSLLIAVVLALLLAANIANPLADLAAAADLGRERHARKVTTGRIRIPDLTSRPDEIGRLSASLRGMVSALYDRIEANEQFAADVAHEIKNPLASLRSAVASLPKVTRDEQRLRLLEVIDHDVRRLDRLVSDISNASRLDSELVKEDQSEFDLVSMLTRLGEHLAIEARDKGVEFIIDMPSTPVKVDGLEGRLAQVFVNLITNAISFCEEGDAVRLWLRKRDNRVLAVVEDTGPGIPEAALEKIFKRFYSERPVGQFGEHSGLGLSISKQIVEAHGGVIWAENIRPTDADITSEPLGARFVVGLPV